MNGGFDRPKMVDSWKDFQDVCCIAGHGGISVRSPATDNNRESHGLVMLYHPDGGTSTIIGGSIG